MKIYFASDHAGFQMKNELLEFVRSLGYETEDCGAYEFDERDDYPEFIKKAAQKVSEDPENSRAIIMGKSGQGEAIVANRFPKVRTVVLYNFNEEIIRLSREHNDANTLSLAAGFLSIEEAKETVRLWLETPFSNEERHARRIKKIDAF